MPINARSVCLVLAAAAASMAVGCGGAATPSPATPAEATPPQPAASKAEPKADAVASVADLPTLQAREVQAGLTKQTVSSPDGQLTIEVEASGKPTMAPDGDVLVLTVPIGTKQPISCDVYKARVDNAGTIARMMGDVGKKVTVTASKPVEVAIASGVPVVFIESDYEVKAKAPEAKEGEAAKDTKKAAADKMAGQFKVAVRAADKHTLVCTHNEVGYKETFRRLVKGMAQSIKPQTDTATYVQIDVLKAGAQPVGFREMRIANDTKNKGAQARIIDTFEAVLLPKTGAELLGQDTTSKVLVDKNGTVHGASFVRTQNGDLSTEVTLRRKPGKDREYSYEGKAQGAPLKGSFKPAKDITTELSRAPLLKKFLGGKDAELAFIGYAPGDDATAPREETYRKEPGDGVVLTQGKASAKVQIDDKGVTEKLEATAAPGLTAERVEVRGNP